ncbi:C-C motif chemokine 3-like [Leuresthes tenuis]|uniref:C-C motif chemokine 3-like n=1 Tax=Leuresthes tenuis TaxID=355514 RepID=UPI003B50FDC6
MKTLCFGLLLLAVCCCDAMPAEQLSITASESCCFKFLSHPIPFRFVTDVTETHSSCPEPGFIVRTTRGRQVCYSQTSQWAQSIYNLTHALRKAVGSIEDQTPDNADVI